MSLFSLFNKKSKEITDVNSEFIQIDEVYNSKEWFMIICQKMIDDEKYDMAFHILYQMTEKLPDFAPPYSLLGVLVQGKMTTFNQDKRAESALWYFTKAYELETTPDNFYFFLGGLLDQPGNPNLELVEELTKSEGFDQMLKYQKDEILFEIKLIKLTGKSLRSKE